MHLHVASMTAKLVPKSLPEYSPGGYCSRYYLSHSTVLFVYLRKWSSSYDEAQLLITLHMLSKIQVACCIAYVSPMWSTSSFLQLSQKFTRNGRLAYFTSKVWLLQNLQDLWCMVYLADCCYLTWNEELLVFYVNNLGNPWIGIYTISMALSSVTCQGEAKDSKRAVNNHQHSWSWRRVRNSHSYLMLVTVVPRTFNGNLKEPWLLWQCLALALPLVSKLSNNKYNDEYYEKDESPGWYRRTSTLISESFSSLCNNDA